MGKSIRAKNKKANRTAQRAKVFQPVEDARSELLAAAQASISAQPRPEAPAADPSSVEATTTAEETIMELDAPKMSKAEREKAYMSRNQLKRKAKARSASVMARKSKGTPLPKNLKKKGGAGGGGEPGLKARGGQIGKKAGFRGRR